MTKLDIYKDAMLSIADLYSAYKYAKNRQKKFSKLMDRHSESSAFTQQQIMWGNLASWYAHEIEKRIKQETPFKDQ